MPQKVLVVDDEPRIRNFVAAILMRYGFEVLQAEDGQAAYELLKRFPVQVVVTDIQMPRMDGLALGEKISAEYPNVNVVYMSAYTSPENVPARRFLSKPFNPDALVLCVRRLCA